MSEQFRVVGWNPQKRRYDTTVLLAATHGVFAIVQFHALGNENPLVSVLTSSTSYASLAAFPFQPLGLLALVILFLMAATSHDFWLRALTPPVWKSLHMLVYVAYAAVVLHVALGQLQTEHDPRLAGVVAAGLVWILTLHTMAGRHERAADAPLQAATVVNEDPFVDVCQVDEIPDRRARIVCLSGERVAIFRYDDKVSAVSNVCQHQNGPLGEGRIVDNCIVCPWHGYEYQPESGASPAPFTEKVPTFRASATAGSWSIPRRFRPARARNRQPSAAPRRIRGRRPRHRR